MKKNSSLIIASSLTVVLLIIGFLLSKKDLIKEAISEVNARPSFYKIEAKLLSIERNYSRFRCHDITIWDCGKYGNIISEDYEVFKHAKPESVLLLRRLDDQIEIVGIVH